MADSDTAPASGSDTELTLRMLPSVGTVEASAWDRLTGGNPFVSHAFLTALEDSGSVGPGTGWQPVPIVLEGPDGGLLGAAPCYAKGHSQGEYVFDHAWAHAWEQAGGDYYPKLQIAVPFTPATGPRLLLADPCYAPPLLRGIERLCRQNSLSSVHATFVEPAQQPLFEQAGWLRRSDIQFHWVNRGYQCFDDFLAGLSSRKRKDLRKERETAQAGVTIKALRGAAIKPEHWDAFWLFYQDTGARKWGQPYLTREAFALMQARMGEQILLILAFDEAGRAIAGALNIIGTDTLYGRYWGCLVDKPCLHFELCYYQAIDFAIAHNLSQVEAGAQGGHKLARGYEPQQTVSMHYLPDKGFRRAVADFLAQEQQGIAEAQSALSGRTPFRKDA